MVIQTAAVISTARRAAAPLLRSTYRSTPVKQTVTAVAPFSSNAESPFQKDKSKHYYTQKESEVSLFKLFRLIKSKHQTSSFHF